MDLPVIVPARATGSSKIPSRKSTIIPSATLWTGKRWTWFWMLAHTFQALNSFHPAVHIHTLEVLPSSHQGQVTLWGRGPTQLTPLIPGLWGQGLYFSGTTMCSEDSSVALLGLGQSGLPSPCDTSQLSFGQVKSRLPRATISLYHIHTAWLEIKLKNQFKRRADYVHELGQIADINSRLSGKPSWAGKPLRLWSPLATGLWCLAVMDFSLSPSLFFCHC